MKTAFVFPGQGSQYIGMGKSLAEKFAAARAIFDQADQALGFSLTQLCFEGPTETLQLTENMQPALLTVSVAAWRVLHDQNVHPDFVAGHSLGEYSALVAAGSLDFADAVRLVRKRGHYMQEAVPVGVGAMAALSKLPLENLERVLAEACQGEVVTAANFNSPDQVVIAGHASAVSRAMELAKGAGARGAILLRVSAPFHCPLMEPAQKRLQADLDATEFRDLTVPLVNGWRAEVVRSGAQARDGLYHQIPNSVRWTEVIAKLASLGVNRIVEVGPGGVLTKLLRSIGSTLQGDNGLEGSKFGEAEDLEKVHAAIA